MRRASNSAAITTAVIYTRVSSEEQEREGLSLAAQLADCRRYVAAHSWVIAGEHQDVMSGKRDDRPSYQALLADVRRLRREGQNVIVVVKWLHRLGRRVLERARAWEELDSMGVSVHSVAEGGQVPKLVADVLAAVAEEESRQIGDRVAATWRHVTAQGWPKIGRVAWGYKLRPATAEERASGSPKSVLDVDPETAPFVVEAFERLAAGYSGRSIVQWATRLPEPARAGRRLSRRTLDGLWRSPLYVARPMTGVSEVLARPSARWPQLVGDQVWQRVQERLDGHRRVPRQASGRFLLTGLLRCPACGGRMVGQSATRSMAKPRYRCGSDAKGSCCTQTADLERVERLVMHRVGAVVDAVATDGRVRRALRKTWQAPREERPSADQERRVGQLEAMLERARGRVVRATELLVDGTIERGAYDELVRKARAEIAAAEAKLGSVSPGGPPAQPSLPPLADVLAAVGEWATSLGGTDVGAQRAVLTVLADRVVAVRERVGVYRTEITWTPLGARLARIAERHDVG